MNETHQQEVAPPNEDMMKKFLSLSPRSAASIRHAINQSLGGSTWTRTDGNTERESATITYGNLGSIQEAWKRDFSGATLAVFRRVIHDTDKTFKDTQYARFMPIIQSSGAGKSRLMDEYAKTAVGIIFTLCSGG